MSAPAEPQASKLGRQLKIGERLGNYRIVRPLGQGGMGAVFEAMHHYIDRKAAVKVLHPDLSQNPQFASRFLNEARAVNLIKHPGLVEIFEFGLLEDGTAYIIMEFLAGVSLSDYLHRAPQGLGSEALPICRQIAQAMAAAHQKGIVHRGLFSATPPATCLGLHQSVETSWKRRISKIRQVMRRAYLPGAAPAAKVYRTYMQTYLCAPSVPRFSLTEFIAQLAARLPHPRNPLRPVQRLA